MWRFLLAGLVTIHYIRYNVVQVKQDKYVILKVAISRASYRWIKLILFIFGFDDRQTDKFTDGHTDGQCQLIFATKSYMLKTIVKFKHDLQPSFC